MPRLVPVGDDAPGGAYGDRPAIRHSDLDARLEGQLRADRDIERHDVGALRRGPRLRRGHAARVLGWAGADGAGPGRSAEGGRRSLTGERW